MELPWNICPNCGTPAPGMRREHLTLDEALRPMGIDSDISDEYTYEPSMEEPLLVVEPFEEQEEEPEEVVDEVEEQEEQEEQELELPVEHPEDIIESEPIEE
jgi:hypothetical protein